MRVAPGQPIPLFLILWDGNDTLFPWARIYSNSGVEVVGSPVALLNVANGIYVAAGPAIGASNLKAAYEVYNDAGHTLRLSRYVSLDDEVESDISNQDVLSEILAKVSGVSPDTIQGLLDTSVLIGLLEIETEQGTLISQEQVGSVEQNEESGILDTSTFIEGELI